MKPFHKGDQVKMASRLAESQTANRRSKVDWVTRRGIVQCGNNYSVSVLWDGAKTKDQLPIGAVEKV